MNLRSRRAFTLIELLIVIGISGVMAGVAITYTRTSQNAVALSIEMAKISQFILQAKSLTAATYTGTSGPTGSCGYGVVFDITQQTYSLFAYVPGGPVCPKLSDVKTNLEGTGITAGQEAQYSPGTWRVPMTKGARLVSQGDSLVTILFYPPRPTVMLSHDGVVFPNALTELKVHLAATTGGAIGTFSVNREGQINF